MLTLISLSMLLCVQPTFSSSPNVSPAKSINSETVPSLVLRPNSQRNQSVRTMQSDSPKGLYAEGYDQHVDLVWQRMSQTDRDRFNIYRSDQPNGPWQKLNARPHTIHVYSDYIGENDRTYYYRVTRIIKKTAGAKASGETNPSEVVAAATYAGDDEMLLTSIQKACFRYFWDFAHPISGLAREGFLHDRNTTTTGGTGFGMLTIMVGTERGFVTREQAAQRLLKMVTFLGEKAQRYHGIWAHHLRGDTGETIPFAGDQDNGGDIVESSFLMQGMLTVREYFDQDNAVENELRERITKLWLEAEWSWYLQPNNESLTWHWSPDYGFVKNHRFSGFNECMITYLLAMASPTYPIRADHYYSGWVRDANHYRNGNTYYGINQPVGKPMGGPLFFTHYSFLALDPRKLTDRHTNYYENNRAISLIQHRYAIDNPNSHEGYSDLVWGLTSSHNPRGYKAHEPRVGQHGGDDGTITPTAALSAFPYTPKESMATLKHFYYEMGAELWGPFGFYDAFNLGKGWVSPSFLAIDQGTMAPMIENYRTGLLWEVFMQSEVAHTILQKLKVARPR